MRMLAFLRTGRSGTRIELPGGRVLWRERSRFRLGPLAPAPAGGWTARARAKLPVRAWDFRRAAVTPTDAAPADRRAAARVRVNQQFYKNMALWVVILVMILLLVTMLRQGETPPPELAYSDFLTRVEAGEVQSVLIEEGHISGQLAMAATSAPTRRP